MKEKIAFVITGYGKDINGGTEQHCRMLAERLTTDYEVEVLTTCVKDYTKGENELPAGTEPYNKVLIRRFEVAPVHPELHHYYIRKSKPYRSFRKLLYAVGLLRHIADIHPVWKCGQEGETKVMQSYVFYSPQLLTYIKEHKDDYKAIIAINISYPLAYYAALYAPEKLILIPTMHYESSTFRSIYTEVFSRVAYIGFNTLSEQKLAERIFGKRHMAPHGIVSVSIEPKACADWETIYQKYQLPEEYLLYVGRIDPGKLHRIVHYFQAYKARHSESKLKLVLVGGLFSAPVKHPDIIYTGFVSESEKYSIIRHAKVFVNPSKFESLSLILLEGMSMGRAMLVNGKCDVLKEHCQRSEGAALAYKSKEDFIEKLYCIENSDELRRQMGEKGIKYVAENYSWSCIMERLKQVIERI